MNVLDHGVVELLDHMGSDLTIVRSARVSTGADDKTPEEDAKLIRYLLKNKHSSPFEKVRFEFYIKAPIFVARQIVRHRTFSWNERSGRYSESLDEFYVPESDEIKGQGKFNKQGSEGEIDCEIKATFRHKVITLSQMELDNYHWALKKGISREMSRILLPVNFYTEWYLGTDLHNLLHFLTLRNDWHSQDQTRIYAQAMEDAIKDIVPITYKIWKELRDIQ